MELFENIKVNDKLKVLSICLPVVIDGDTLIGVAHHGDEHVEEDDDVAAWVDAEHQQSPEPSELLYS